MKREGINSQAADDDDMTISSSAPTDPLELAMMQLKSGITRASFTRPAMAHTQTTPLNGEDTLDTLKIDTSGIAEAVKFALEQLMFGRIPKLRDKPKKLERALGQVTIPDFTTQTTLEEIARVLNQTLIPECEEKLTGH